MAKKNSEQDKKPEMDSKLGSAKEDEFSKLGIELPKEAQKRLKEIKDKIDSFKDKLITKFDKYIMGVALLPPNRPIGAPPLGQMHASVMPQMQQTQTVEQREQEEKLKRQINVLVLIDDSDSKKMTKEELKTKLGAIISGMGQETDPDIAVQTLILSEVWQSCYDAKYDSLQLIAMSAPVYDTGMLAAIKIAEVHKTMVLKKFERYIVSYVLAGSLVQGKATEKSDVDVFIVIDDTDVKRMTRVELKDKLRAIIIGMGIEAGELTGVKNKINIQVYILTDFWDSIKEANPIIFTFLRDGVPFYDRGIYMPWKQLLQMGRIKPSSEAIEMYMNTGDQMLKRVKFKLKEIGMEDTFWAILTPSQAALMLYGVPPPTPKETPEVMREIFVRKEGLLEEEFVKILERNIQVRKDLEHGDKKDLTGNEVDELLNDSERYLKRIDQLFKEIEKTKEEESVAETYDTVVTLLRDVLKTEGIETTADAELVKVFEDKMISSGKIPAKLLRVLNAVMKAKNDYDENKITKALIEKTKKDANLLIRSLLEYVQRKRGRELDRAKIKVKYGNKYGEVILLGEDAFVISDVDSGEKEISKAKVTAQGGLTGRKKSSYEEMEKAIAKLNVPPKVFIKEKIFEDLKEIFGEDVEVLVNY